MPADTSVFNNIRTFSDYNKADQEFQLKKQAAIAENQAKQLSLAGQVIGNSAVDQDSYDRARQFANSQGIDTSFLPDQFNPDVVNRLRFAGATPTAQLSAMLQQQQMALRAGTATGDVTRFGYGNGNKSAPVTPPLSNAPQGQKNMSLADRNSATNDLFSDNTPQVDLTQSNGQSIAETAPLPTAPVSNKFNPPAQRAGETVAAYKERVDQAFNAFKSDPSYIAESKKAEKKGEFAATNEEGANVQTQTLERLNQNLDALKSLNDNLPEYGGILPVSVKARAGLIGGKMMGDSGVGYDASQKWDEINQQQVVNAIGDLVKGGQIRGNQFIEKIIKQGYAIDPDAPRSTRADQIEILRNELKNAAAQAQNISGGNAAYTPTLPNAVSKEDAINELRRRKKI